jgi:NTP pyrophosphatase (non-canonical NTP hydrolase)
MRRQMEEEMADVLLYLVRLADKLDVDLVAVAERKLRANAMKYPVEKARKRGRRRGFDEEGRRRRRATRGRVPLLRIS